ncbi:hypothetical protein HBH56_137270 [Parastagonospora nodorum]|uniref:Uncharacterized protein n=1 Tax=Phaeosphaeria nodorum (strain SN15 / ATCC MYA-4574 / FGSC 10173) TaxID=321614 RepID=A0A7U2HTK4_PHANO|nr:hypothetical protein HBH56_137270 [Parastagonospora nodorum]QRC91320.1 hypothetical protein JI435_008220 [Parastagonospora nodorum SN15]KAH3927993.1 hypothetical protein HBH54_142400 [Parastagonospora nodorum]KAH3972350.1 hypothetical protein HBH52_152830 [Parastagonospora nodorum]KAH3982630.1 hypothetical protein HBH51_035720 [Parastagonospora nodorum]
MKAFTILAALLTVVAATNPFAARADCSCDISKCPTSGPAHCVCVTGLLDSCYVAQTNAGIDCGKPVYPDGCSSSTPIQNQACGGSGGGKCGTDEICYVPDKNCDIHSGKCTGLCASDYCGGQWDKQCADDRWSCVYDDACLKNGGVDCDGHCVLN